LMMTPAETPSLSSLLVDPGFFANSFILVLDYLLRPTFTFSLALIFG
jgi:hypothetical protein